MEINDLFNSVGGLITAMMNFGTTNSSGSYYNTDNNLSLGYSQPNHGQYKSVTEIGNEKRAKFRAKSKKDGFKFECSMGEGEIYSNGYMPILIDSIGDVYYWDTRKNKFFTFNIDGKFYCKNNSTNQIGREIYDKLKVK